LTLKLAATAQRDPHDTRSTFSMSSKNEHPPPRPNTPAFAFSLSADIIKGWECEQIRQEQQMEPLRFEPILKPKIWGGRRMEALLAKSLPPGRVIGESWELSDHPASPSRVAGGADKGLALRQIIERYPADVLGSDCPAAWRQQFPILVKFLDADQPLSVQVHPDDAFAVEHALGTGGKTECWVVLHAEPDAWVVRGLKDGVTKDGLRQAIDEGTLEDILNRIGVKKGDFVFVPAGTVHAIGPGLLLAEIQQTSDTTYRLWDWGRLGADGQPRDLHVDRALECTHFGDAEPPSAGNKTAASGGTACTELCNCHAFGLRRVEIEAVEWQDEAGEDFAIVVAISGAGELASADAASLEIRAGDTVLVPASGQPLGLRATGRLTALVVSPPTLRV
ncbi:MAG: class I mannose-6-phosphate isomerase, partial [Phycisphaerae bacterium]|nr:class I mannose-6-phosphate isomerase [Phycisphaerae bacterium]